MALGDTIYRASLVWKRLVGNTTTSRKFFSQTGDGVNSAAPSWERIVESDIDLSDNTTNNSSTTKHGFLKKLDNNATSFMNGQGNWATPSGSGADANLTYLTEDDETGTLVNSRRLLAGTGITFDDTTPGERTIEASAAGAGGPASISLLTSGTAATYTVPAGINRIFVTVVGAGGGGGGADGQTGAGGGGGAGSVAHIAYDVSPSDTFTYTIGALGTGGAAGNNAGTQGGSTLFDEGGSVVTAVGGNGGGSMAAGSTLQGTSTVAPVVATGGDINLYGAMPERGIRFSLTIAMGSAGASGSYGAGGQPAINNDGLAASGYGAGGGGCFASTSTDRAGGDGAPGVIIIAEYE